MKPLVKKIVIATGTFVICLAIFAAFFARVIPRTIPTEGIVSPASGKVIKIIESASSDIIFEKNGTVNHTTVREVSGPVHIILIELNLHDVHVQRAPISGTVVRTTHYDGNHENALGAEKEAIAATNEKVVTVFHSDDTTLAVIQVAGRAARRIRNRIVGGSPVIKGDVYGRILLGSQVVVILPQDKELLVHEGDRMVDGETLLAK